MHEKITTESESKTTELDPELDLDPEDWQEFGRVAHKALDDALDLLKDVRERGFWRPVPDDVTSSLDEGLPRQGAPIDQVYDQIRDSILPYPTGNIHPRFWGWVMGNGTAEGVVADMVASAMNPHLGGYDQSASQVEHRVIQWLTELMGYPQESSGLLVSGGTVANLTGIAVARKAKCPWDIREEGLSNRPSLRFYGSQDTHSWTEKAADLLGLGRRAFVRIPSDDSHRIDMQALKVRIDQDRRDGHLPFCVVGNAGTVNTGAIDDLDALADFCRQEDLWLHVDGAFGALIALSPELSPRLKGMDRSNSVAFDLHKWGYLQYELGCVLCRHSDIHRQTFATSANYLEAPGRGIQPSTLELAELGIQLSRGFRALKVWTSFKTHGVEKIGRVIAQNVDQARYLADRVQQEPDLELMAEVPLNIVCFRFGSQDLSDSDLDDLNREILVRLQEDGIAVPSSTRIQGRFCLRVAITNHRSVRADFDALADAVLDIGRQLRSTI